MTNTQILIMILAASAVTAGVRLLPFIVFKGGKTPAFVTWLGAQLPAAVMAMLLVYCLKDVSFGSAPAWIPAVCGVIATSALHVWKKQMMLSICGGTVIYMLLLRLI